MSATSPLPRRNPHAAIIAAHIAKHGARRIGAPVAKPATVDKRTPAVICAARALDTVNWAIRFILDRGRSVLSAECETLDTLGTYWSRALDHAVAAS